MSINLYMKNNMKNIFILVLLFVFGKTAEANMVLASFSLKGASSDNKITVSDSQVPTDIEFSFNLMKYSDPSSPGDCYVTLLYTESQENNNYDSHLSTIELSPIKHIKKSEFASNGTIYQSIWLPAILPAYRFSGKILLRYRFFNSAQNKEVTLYSTVKYEINAPSYVSPDDLSKIQSMGFSTTGIRNFKNDYYLIENDLLIKKSSLNVINPVYAVNNDKEHNINVWVKPAINPANPDWDNAISLAVAAWNANPSSDIKLHLVSQYGTSDVPPPYDIIIDSDLGVLPSNQPNAVEYTNGDGKAGGLILVNSDYGYSSSTQLVNIIIHSLGHSLGLKHSSNTNSIMVNNNLAGYTNAFPSSVDEPIISALYPLNMNSTVTPYISGTANLPHYSWTQDYEMSYIVLGITYKWTSNTPHWFLPYEVTSQTKLPEMNFSTGTHELKCTTSQSKYVTPIIAIKNIVVQ